MPTADRALTDLWEPGRILIVDDEPANRELLRGLLEQSGYRIEEAADGLDGLARAAAGEPDVILLDVMMPKLDGFTVCRRLKAAPRTAPVPVLIVSSLSAREERLEGIRAGASDFVTKPIDGADLLLRVRNALISKRLFDDMQAQYVRLRELESLRDSMVHMLVHDVRSPLGALFSYLHMMRLDAAEAGATDTLQMIDTMKLLARRMNDMVDTVLDVSRLESGAMCIDPREGDLRELVATALTVLDPEERPRVQVRVPDRPLRISFDRPLLERVLTNLLGNALKFSDEGTTVTISVQAEADGARVAVHDAGPGIPESELDRIFDKYRQAPSAGRARGFGLGLTFCRMAVEAHGGEIGVVSAAGAGSTFWFRLPGSPRQEAPARAGP